MFLASYIWREGRREGGKGKRGLARVARARVRTPPPNSLLLPSSPTCCVSSGTDSDRYCCDPREVSGAKPTMKKWRRGNGMRLTASLRRSAFSWPGKRRQQVTPDMTADMRWLRSPKVGVVSWGGEGRGGGGSAAAARRAAPRVRLSLL
jgi:hypothetical protein